MARPPGRHYDRPHDPIVNIHPTSTSTLMHGLGRLMQGLGLAVMPLSMVLQLVGTLKVGQMLVMALAGVCLFWIGRIVEGYSRWRRSPIVSGRFCAVFLLSASAASGTVSGDATVAAGRIRPFRRQGLLL